MSKFLNVAFLALALALASCVEPADWLGTADAAKARPAKPGPIASLQIIPGSVMLPGSRATRELSAQAFDAQGLPVRLKGKNRPAWTSSRPAVVAVDSRGVITSFATAGSAQIVAQVDGVRSQPVLVTIATPVAGAQLVSDSQVIGEPELVDPDDGLHVGSLYRVRVTGLSAPTVGGILLGSETAPIAGKVVEVQPDGSGGFFVVLALVPLTSLFRDLAIDEVIDLSRIEPQVPERIGNAYDVARDTATGLYTFTPKPGAAQAKAATGTRALGPFECESETEVALVEVTPASFSLQPTLSLDLRYDSANGGLQRLTLNGQLEGEVKSEFKFSAAFEGKIECKGELFQIPLPIGGPLAWFFGGFVPVGLGFDIGGEITAAEFGVELSGKVTASAQAGLSCVPVAGCGPVATGSVTAEPESEFTSPSQASVSVQVDPELHTYAFSSLALGFRALRRARLDAFDLKAGPLLKGSFATPTAQVTDPNYASSYQASLDLVLERSDDLNTVFELLDVSGVLEELRLSAALARSPTATEAKSDRSTFVAGDPVGFTVKLDPANLTFGVFGENVDAVQIYRKVTTISGEEIAERVAETTGIPGLVDYTLSWPASEAGAIRDTFFAFVRTRLLPLPAIGSLEVAAVQPTTDCADGADNDGDGKVDLLDPGCTNAGDDSETNPQCSDGIDNDGDGSVDAGDPGCTSPSDDSELNATACNDGTDNDGDTLIDGGDPGCGAGDHTSEAPNPECLASDGVDDDGDFLTDLADIGCQSLINIENDPWSTGVRVGSSPYETAFNGGTMSYICTLSPAQVTVPRSTDPRTAGRAVVTLRNTGTQPIRIRSPDFRVSNFGTFLSLAPGEQKAFGFNVAGTYSYFCRGGATSDFSGNNFIETSGSINVP